MKTEKEGLSPESKTLALFQPNRIKKISPEIIRSINNQTRQFIDEKKSSGITKIALPTLRRWRHEGKGPSYIKIGRMVRYDLDELLKFMDSHKIDLGG